MCYRGGGFGRRGAVHRDAGCRLQCWHGSAASSTRSGGNSAGAEFRGTTSGAASAARRDDVERVAAASLKATFTQIGAIFQQQNPGTTVAFNFAGSADLVTQLTAGAPARCVRVCGHREHDQGDRRRIWSPGTPVNFATNTLTIVTKPGNPEAITSFADLAKADVAVVVCAPRVPCGAAGQQVEADTGCDADPGERGELGDRRARQGQQR